LPQIWDKEDYKTNPQHVSIILPLARKGETMYYSERVFDKQQLIFMVDTVLGSAMDQIASCLPPDSDMFQHESSQSDFGNGYVQGCQNTAGHALSVLFAQITGDGMGATDAIAIIKFDEFVDDFQIAALANGGRVLNPGTRYFPNTRPLAIKFVNEVFDEYLKNIPIYITVVPARLAGRKGTEDLKKTNAFDCEKVFVEKCKELYNDDQGNDFESWICEIADNGEDFSIDLAMRVTKGRMNIPVSFDTESYSDDQDHESYTANEMIVSMFDGMLSLPG